MSKITNDGLTWSGTRCFDSCTNMTTLGVKGLIEIKLVDLLYFIKNLLLN